MEGGSCLTLREHLPDPATHRIYFDFGTETLDALYRPTQTLVDDLMLAAGYEPDDNWMPRMFPGARHFEIDWAMRVHIPAKFMLS